jgi:hypothetical protein
MVSEQEWRQATRPPYNLGEVHRIAPAMTSVVLNGIAKGSSGIGSP